MTTADRLNQLLHSRQAPQRHAVKVGEELDIQLPRVPLTGETQFIELHAALSGQPESIQVSGKPGALEGSLLPRFLHARGVMPGRAVISVSALDALSRQPIAGVEPVEIIVDVTEE